LPLPPVFFFLPALVPLAFQLQQKNKKKEGDVGGVTFSDAKKRRGDDNTVVTFFAA
jgi:hypothetical protein